MSETAATVETPHYDVNLLHVGSGQLAGLADFSDVADSLARKCAGFGVSEDSCNPIKVTRPELLIEGGVFRSQA